jgi:hypothetical protein
MVEHCKNFARNTSSLLSSKEKNMNIPNIESWELGLQAVTECPCL